MCFEDYRSKTANIKILLLSIGQLASASEAAICIKKAEIRIKIHC